MNLSTFLSLNGSGKKMGTDVILAGIGISAPIASMLGRIETLLAVIVAVLMIVLLGIRIVSQWISLRRKLRDEDKDSGNES